MFCHKCGNKIDDGDRFCPKCGEPVVSGQPVQDDNLYDAGHETPEVITSDSPDEMPYDEFYGGQNEDINIETEPAYDDFSEMQGTEGGKRPGGGKGKLIVIIAIIVIVIALAAVVIFAFVPGTSGNNDKKDSGKVVESVASTEEKNETITTPEAEMTVETTVSEETTPEVATAEETTQPETETVAAPYNQQVVTVEPNGSTSLLTLEQWNENGTWDTVFSCEAKVSTNGTTAAYGQGIRYTPSGTFDILFCIGATQPETALKFIPVHDGDVWVDDTYSYYYNTLQTGDAYYKDWTSTEDIYEYFGTGENNAAIFFSYNGDGLNGGTATFGRGATIFLFGRTGFSDTTTDSGDLLISQENMTILLGYLDSSKNPQITIY